MKQQILAEARAKLRELSEMIARLQREYDEKVAQKEELERRSRMLQLKLERAEALITGLSGILKQILVLLVFGLWKNRERPCEELPFLL